MRWLGLSIVAAWVATAAAAPQVDIKAQTQLALDKVRLEGNGESQAYISGQLLDKFTGDGIGNQLVVVHISDQSQAATTGPDGRFKVTVDNVSPGEQLVELEFRGGASLDAAKLSQRTDPSRAQVELSIGVEDAPGGAKLVVHASADGATAQLPIQLAVGLPTDAELAPLARIESNTPFLLTRKAAGGPGTRRVRASYLGDPTRQAANAEATLELASTTKTTMRINSATLAFEDVLVVTGAVLDEDDHPVSRATVVLGSGDRRLAHGATAEDGSYKFKIEAEVIGEGTFGLQVASEPITAYMKSSRSEPVVIKIAAPQPVPVSYTVIAFLATAFAAGGFFLARSKPWLRFRRQAPPAEVPTTAAEIEQLDGGLVVAKPGLVSTLRRPNDDGFSGVLRDTVRGRPIGDAVVRLLFGDTEREVRSADDGSFAIEKLGVGEWSAEVAAVGHVTERFTITIPHRGELRGVRVDLVPVRERVFQLYRRAAEPVLPEARLWGVWSPRQIVDHVRRQRPTPALAELTDFVEELYFSPRLAAETVLVYANEHVERAIRERMRATS